MRNAVIASSRRCVTRGDFHIALNHIAAFKPLDFPLLVATDLGMSMPGNWVGFLFQNAAAPYALPNIRSIQTTLKRHSSARRICAAQAG